MFNRIIQKSHSYLYLKNHATNALKTLLKEDDQIDCVFDLQNHKRFNFIENPTLDTSGMGGKYFPNFSFDENSPFTLKN